MGQVWQLRRLGHGSLAVHSPGLFALGVGDERFDRLVDHGFEGWTGPAKRDATTAATVDHGPDMANAGGRVLAVEGEIEADPASNGSIVWQRDERSTDRDVEHLGLDVDRSLTPEEAATRKRQLH